MTSPVGGRHGVKAYTTPRSFGGFQIPIALQSAAIRRYCDECDLVFHHHSSENLAAHSFAVLASITDSAEHLAGIAMCSVQMLPESLPLREHLLRRATDAGCPVHFVFERLVVSSHSDLSAVTELLELVALTRATSVRAAELQRLAAVLASS